MTSNGSRLDERSILVWTKFIDAGAGFYRTANCSITILRTLLERGALTSVELESITGMCRGTVTSTLNSLRKNGYLVFTGEMRRSSGGRGTAWNRMCKEYNLRAIPPHHRVARPTNDAVASVATSMVVDRRVIVLENENKVLREALAAAEGALWNALETIESVKKTEKEGAA
jgi:hypothetical protein